MLFRSYVDFIVMRSYLVRRKFRWKLFLNFLRILSNIAKMYSRKNIADYFLKEVVTERFSFSLTHGYFVEVVVSYSWDFSFA